jgi:heme-degrading monooxygenase HmoA
MFARVSTIHGTPEHLEEAIRYLAAPASFRQAQGFKGNYLLVDRERGKMLTISLWETEADLQATAESVNPLRQEGARLAGAAELPSVEVYEVAIQPYTVVRND